MIKRKKIPLKEKEKEITVAMKLCSTTARTFDEINVIKYQAFRTRIAKHDETLLELNNLPDRCWIINSHRIGQLGSVTFVQTIEKILSFGKGANASAGKP